MPPQVPSENGEAQEVPVPAEPTVEEVPQEEPPAEPAENGSKEAPEAPAPVPGVADEELDVFGVEVSDVGNGEPLCSLFALEDWVLLMLRVEFHLMAHAFKKDVEDAQRLGIHVDNVPYYYNKYFKKSFSAWALRAKSPFNQRQATTAAKATRRWWAC